MLDLITPSIQSIILDMDGVLWRGNQPLCDLPILFINFAKTKIKVILATNNATHTVQQTIDKVEKFGVIIQPWQVITSAMATGYLMKQDFPEGGPVFILGEQALIDTLSDFDFYHDEENPVAVVAGLDRNLTYDRIQKTSLIIQKGLPFYFTNLDPTFPTAEGLSPGAGTVLAALEAASGVKAILAGKPLPYLYDIALKRLQTEPISTLVAGDRLDTDIIGGKRAGCKTVLVLSGVTKKEDLESFKIKSDFVINNISDLFSSDP
ncbi:MAG TPA: HAD-IIA family hydrolase [Anaerolineae bacterium]|nr:HAD-IIA family hydrolase [Anaerolineae bacterium]